ncbi:MAG TPA: BrnA antitoxin family protein, partial [Methylocella sp.]|nr:BrnA antitoxin family protein [Methylocella sp.]
SELTARRPGQRGKGKRPAKVPVTIRLDPDVLARLRAQGPGWQTRLSALLEKAVHKAPGKPPRRAKA